MRIRALYNGLAGLAIVTMIAAPVAQAQSPNLFQVPMGPQTMQPLVPGVISPRPNPPGVLSPLLPGMPVKPNPPAGNDPWVPPVFPGNGAGSVCAVTPWLPQCSNNTCFQNPSLPQCRGTGSIYVPPPPGTPGPVDANGRPIIYSATNVPAEYDCPLFENRPHEALNQAMDALSYAMASTPECSQQRSSIDAIHQNNNAIREAVKLLQTFMMTGGAVSQPNTDPSLPPMPGQFPQPGGATLSPQQLEQSINAAIQATSNLGQIFGNNTLLQSRCGREIMSSGKVLIALNDIVNNLAPYALLAVAVNPALGMAAKFAITGGSMATSAIASMVKMIDQGTVDMNNPEHRKAVLKNTCQFTNIARKVRFMQLAQSGQIHKISEELDKKLAVYKKFLSRKSDDLSQILAYKESIERIAGRAEFQARKDFFELSALEGQIRESQNDPLYTCLIAQQMIRNSARQDIAVFPVTIIENLRQAVELNREDQNSARIVSIRTLNDVSRKRIAALEPRVRKDDGAAIKMCADTTKSWINGLRQAIRLAQAMLNDERENVEKELSTNPEYTAWRDQYRRLQEEQGTVSRVARVMKELAKDNSVIDRSELDQRITLLKRSLFGVSGSWRLGRSPIQEWLEHTLRLHGNRISSMHQNIKQLQAAAFELSESGRIVNHPGSYRIPDPVYFEHLRRAGKVMANLDSITVDTIKPGTRGHEIACQTFETAWLDWSASVDHLGATEFMCDMIDSHLDNKVEKALVSFCRGQLAFDGRQVVKSRIQDAKARVAITKAISNKSYRDWAFLVSKKMNDLKCPMPGTSDLH